MSLSETQISRGIQDAIEAMGLIVERLQSGTATGLRGGRMRLASPGTPDLFVAVGGGLFLECKTPTGKLSENQLRWHRIARAHGVRVEVVRSVEDAVRVVLEMRRMQG